jgi:hypothetical protein
MNISEIEEKLRNITNNLSSDTFVYDLLHAYGKPKASIARLQKGTLNRSKRDDEILWPKQICFRTLETSHLLSSFNQICQDKYITKHNPRFIVASDYKTLLALDTKNSLTLNIPIDALPEHCDFFLPLAGREKATIHKDHEADVKAAEKMAGIYDEICKLNPSMNSHQKDAHALNVFLSRLLFCYFADSTEIFPKNIFIETLSNFTEEDGSNLREFFDELFERLNTNIARSKCPKYLKDFPYVNGGLFKERFKIPKFSTRLRKMIIDCGKLDWSSINPDIFGSMIQSVVDPAQRSHLGMHYTSVPNIMKVIRPLLLDELYEELASSKSNKKKLNELYDRLGKIRIFDPACGSGNFLIIAYKELRLFEIQLLKQLERLGKHPTFSSQIQLSQFYGIEIDEFACEVAKLSLWIAEHQMNRVSERTFNKWAASLPLKEGGHIVCGNATRLDWEKVCPKDRDAEIYILGNPPYLGARNQNKDQKLDVTHALGTLAGRNDLDYISCWIVKGSTYIRNFNAQCAFVSTNSIFQGSQVSILWPSILKNSLEISFAYNSFKWSNHAKKNAAVICVISGLRNISNKSKQIYNGLDRKHCKNINCYLVNSANIYIENRRSPISTLPQMSFGSMPNDGGHLILHPQEYTELVRAFPKCRQFIREAIGAKEFISGARRYCLWISDDSVNKASSIPQIKNRIEKVKRHRAKSKRKATRELSKLAHRFGEIRHVEGASIVIPRVSSERREYIPFGYTQDVILDSAQAIYNAEPHVFGIISSRMHMVWVRTVAGRLKTDYRYSSAICYNNFPIPDLNKKQKETINLHIRNLLSEREKHPDKTIAELYDPKKMPAGLRKAHQDLDAAVERCYRSKPFESDEERLEHLFKLYEEMIQAEKRRK